MLAIGPRVAALFPLWLMGLASYRLGRRHPPGQRLGWALCAGALIAFLLYEQVAYRYGELYSEFSFSPERLHDYAPDYIVGILVSLHLYGFRAASGAFAPVLLRFERPIRWVAGATFALYLFHVPLIETVVALAPWPVTSWPTRALVFIGVPLIVFALAEVTERRKAAWRRAILALLAIGGVDRRSALARTP